MKLCYKCYLIFSFFSLPPRGILGWVLWHSEEFPRLAE